MSLRSKNRILTATVIIIFTILLSFLSREVMAAENLKVIPIKIGDHKGFTRIVFDMPKLSAYHIENSSKEILIHLDTNFRTVLSKPPSSIVKNVEISRNKDGLLEIKVTTKKKIKTKDYRLRKKIIVDIYAVNNIANKIKNHKAKLVEKIKPKKLAKIKNSNSISVKATHNKKESVRELKKALSGYIKLSKSAPPTEFGLKVAKVEKVEKKDLKINKPIKTKKIISKDKKTSSYNEEFYQKNPTEITLSFLEATKLAVFKRSKTLWIVTDSIADAVFPTVKGPLERFISYPQILRFKKGTAYAYKLPKEFFLKIKKQNLLWKIDLLPKALKTAEEVETQTYFDDFGKNAKMSFALNGAGDSIKFEDPIVGDTLYVIPTKYVDQVVTNKNHTVDFKIKTAALGMVVKPFTDSLKVYPVDNFIFISSANGLKITPAGMGTPVLVGEDEDNSLDEEIIRLFDFPNWSMGGIKQFYNNRQEIYDEIISANNPEDRAGALIKLAMLYFSNNFGHETLGVLDLLLSENIEMKNNSLFIAVRGAANAMSGYYKKALRDLSTPAIKNNPEARMWMGFAAAATEQWTRANELFPKSNRLLIPYPDTIAIPMTLYMAESSLHLGRINIAKKLLDSINMKSEVMNIHHRSAIDYLRGEIYKQKDNTVKAEKLWLPVANGVDRLYHTKASLSLTRLLLREKTISLHEAIERLENLRFAWRGDGLEIEILRNLGELKAENNKPLAGLEDLRKAVKLSKMDLIDTTPLREVMIKIFVNLFINKEATKVTPLETISVYNEFNYLIPSGRKGVKVSLSFADYLIKMDLLKEATDIIERQIEADIPKKELPSIGAKLAAIYLLDREPEKSLDAIRKTDVGEISKKEYAERTILKARAYSDLGNIKMATLVLNTLKSKNAMLLKADIFWKQEDWNNAAKTLEKLLPNPETAHKKEDLSIILNTVIAWKLDGNETKVKEIKDKYTFAMKNTDFQNSFNVITRQDGSSELANRKTTLKIAAEADIFKSFLETYKNKKQ